MAFAQYHPSCAVYQQTPEGKTLVHRAKMSSVYSRRKVRTASVFAASLPRTVVVEGTFQVGARNTAIACDHVHHDRGGEEDICCVPFEPTPIQETKNDCPGASKVMLTPEFPQFDWFVLLVSW